MYYTFDQLFANRESTGNRLQEILIERKCTKMQLSRGTGISRPTIDKLINGAITSKNTFDKHMNKIFNYLNISEDVFATKDKFAKNRIDNLKHITGLSIRNISNVSNIPQNILVDFDLNEKVSLNDSVKLAYSFSTSTRIIENSNFFNPQFLNIENKNNIDEECQFWGFIRIKLKNCDIDKYYPITLNTMKSIYNNLNFGEIIVPCLNNKVLLLNMKNIKKISLISNNTVDFKKNRHLKKVMDETYPLVIYELLDTDYFNESVNMSTIDFDFNLVSKKKDLNIETSVFYYEDGECENECINFSKSEILLKEIVSKYRALDNEIMNLLPVCNTDGTNDIFNFDYLSIIEMPLLKLEKSIIDSIK